MTISIDFQRLVPAWREVQAAAPFSHIESEQDYNQMTALLNRLLDVVRDDEKHPLYSLVSVVGDLIESYESTLDPLSEQRFG